MCTCFRPPFSLASPFPQAGLGPLGPPGSPLPYSTADLEGQPSHSVKKTVVVADVADIKFYLRIGQVDSHIFLILLITAEDADLLDIGIEKAAQDGVSEGAGAAGDEKGLAA